MAATNEFTYPYNPNGVLDECKITGEAHTITPGAGKNYNWFIPNAAPFFGFSVVLKHVASGKTLQRGVDYNLGLEYHQFNTQVTLRPVYAAIVLIDTSLTGQFILDYMTIGGQYAINETKALAYMANAAIDPRVTQWDSVTDIPPQFPVTQHLHDVVDIVGMSDVVTAIQALTVAMLSGGGKWFQSLNEHLNDFNDPHHVLDMIPGDGGSAIAKATQQQAIEGVDNTAYMTSLRVAQYCAANILSVINDHIADKNNPHGVDKAAVGLALVQNLALAVKADVDGNTNLGNYATLEVAMYAAQLAVQAYQTTYAQSMATQQEAEAGINSTHWMPPLRVAQFVAAGVGKALQTHIDATGNVHGLTAKDINLEQLINSRQATNSDYDGSTTGNDTLYVNLALLRHVMAAVTGNLDLSAYAKTTDVNDAISAAFRDANNYPKATPAEVAGGKVNDKLITPLGLAGALNNLGYLTALGVCVTAGERAAYLAQNTVLDPMVDVTNNEVYTYDADITQTWVLSSGVSAADEIQPGKAYFNLLSRKGYFCPATAGVVQKITDVAPKVTVSNSVPPTDTTGYSEGHVWYQVS